MIKQTLFGIMLSTTQNESTMNWVLLIDDDAELVGMMKEYLEQDGFCVGTAYDGAAGIKEALSGRYDIVILDVMMPLYNGVEVLRQIRQKSPVPVLMLTAKGDDADRVTGLELGADDYVAKPCTPRELSARIRAILRRTYNTTLTEDNTIVAGNIVIWPALRQAQLHGMPLSLTSTEFNLLELLMRHAGHPVSKNTLSEEGLGRPMTRFDRNIDVHLSNLRQKLGHRSDGKSFIETVYRQGYQLISE